MEEDSHFCKLYINRQTDVHPHMHTRTHCLHMNPRNQWSYPMWQGDLQVNVKYSEMVRSSCLPWCRVTRRHNKIRKNGELAIKAMPGEMWRWELGDSAPAETGHSKYPGSSKEPPDRTKPQSHWTFKIGVSNFWLIFNSTPRGIPYCRKRGLAKGSVRIFIVLW